MCPKAPLEQRAAMMLHRFTGDQDADESGIPGQEPGAAAERRCRWRCLLQLGTCLEDEDPPVSPVCQNAECNQGSRIDERHDTTGPNLRHDLGRAVRGAPGGVGDGGER